LLLLFIVLLKGKGAFLALIEKKGDLLLMQFNEPRRGIFSFPIVLLAIEEVPCDLGSSLN